MNFHVGQKVVCVDGNWALRKGEVYQVTALRGRVISNGFICVANGGGRLDGGWMPSRFRPAQERKTDISAFTALLNTNSVKELIK